MTGRSALLGSAGGFALTLSALALGACQQRAQNAVTQPVTAAPAAALPLATAEPPPVAAAPPASALPPPTQPVRYVPRQPRERYRYINDAYAMGDAFGDAPPDYAVDYGGTRPWVWRSHNGAYRVVERLPYGERDYYYEPGADRPYFVSDPEYSYAYDDGVLVAAYDRRGAPLPDYLARQRARDAARYFDRARALHRAALYQPRQSAYAADWRERAPDIERQRRQWAEQAREDEDWRAWRDSHAGEEQRQWGAERGQREAYTAAVTAALAGAVGALAGHDHGDRNKPAVATSTAQTAPPATQLATATKLTPAAPVQPTAAPAPQPAETTNPATPAPRHLAATMAPAAQAPPPVKPAEAPKAVVAQKAPPRANLAEALKREMAQRAPGLAKPAEAPKKVVVQEAPAKAKPVEVANASVEETVKTEPPPHPAAAALAAREQHQRAHPKTPNPAASTALPIAATEQPKHEAATPLPAATAKSETQPPPGAERGRSEAALAHAGPPKTPPGQAAGRHPAREERTDKDKRKKKSDEPS